VDPRTVTTGTGWAVAAAILFWPLGIPALVGAQRASRALGAGDLAAAVQHARAARRYGVAAVVVTAVLSAVLSLALIVLLTAALARAGWPGLDLAAAPGTTRG